MKLHETIKTGEAIGKYLTGKETEEERERIEQWITQNEKNPDFFRNLKKEREIVGAVDQYEKYNKENAWRTYINRIASISLRRSLLRWKVAAVFFFLLASAGVISYFANQTKGNLVSSQVYTTVTTNNGQTSKITLPDHSVVWVNSGTTFSYNSDFGLRNRDIKLSGQAYFQVERNEKIPLIVDCNDLQVKVLGTKFDVAAYPKNKEINVVLESGSVELLNSNDKAFDYILKPGEMARFNSKKNELKIEKADTYKFTSWKDGILIFENDPMTEVFEKLERWYNIDIIIKNSKVEHQIFNATIVNENVDEIFELIKFSCAVNYRIIRSNQPDIPIKVIITE